MHFLLGQSELIKYGCVGDVVPLANDAGSTVLKALGKQDRIREESHIMLRAQYSTSMLVSVLD